MPTLKMYEKATDTWKYVGGGGGTGASTADAVTYHNPTYPTVEAALDKLLYVNPTVSLSGGSSNEAGAAVNTVTLAFSTNKPCTLTIDGIGVVTTSPVVLSGQNITSNTTYRITADDGTTQAQASTYITFTHKRWYGAADQTLIDLLDAYASGDFSYTNFDNLSNGLSESHSLSSYDHPAGYPIFAVYGSTPLSCTWLGASVGLEQKAVTVVNQHGDKATYTVAWAQQQSDPIRLSWS